MRMGVQPGMLEPPHTSVQCALLFAHTRAAAAQLTTPWAAPRRNAMTERGAHRLCWVERDRRGAAVERQLPVGRARVTTWPAARQVPRRNRAGLAAPTDDVVPGGGEARAGAAVRVHGWASLQVAARLRATRNAQAAASGWLSKGAHHNPPCLANDAPRTCRAPLPACCQSCSNPGPSRRAASARPARRRPERAGRSSRRRGARTRGARAAAAPAAPAIAGVTATAECVGSSVLRRSSAHC